MNFISAFLVAFFLIFLSELGDKTQLLVLSFSTKLKSYRILIGVALGSFLSHGIAILFGSFIGNLDNIWVHSIIQCLTYISFLFFGIITLMQSKNKVNLSNEKDHSCTKTFLSRFSSFPFGYILIIAFSIAIGELGDKTFLASLGLGISYPNYKFFLILGAILGMVLSDCLALLLGKFLKNKISPRYLDRISGILFLLFGSFGFISFLISIL